MSKPITTPYPVPFIDFQHRHAGQTKFYTALQARDLFKGQRSCMPRELCGVDVDGAIGVATPITGVAVLVEGFSQLSSNPAWGFFKVVGGIATTIFGFGASSSARAAKEATETAERTAQELRNELAQVHATAKALQEQNAEMSNLIKGDDSLKTRLAELQALQIQQATAQGRLEKTQEDLTATEGRLTAATQRLEQVEGRIDSGSVRLGLVINHLERAATAAPGSALRAITVHA